MTLFLLGIAATLLFLDIQDRFRYSFRMSFKATSRDGLIEALEAALEELDPQDDADDDEPPADTAGPRCCE